MFRIVSCPEEYKPDDRECDYCQARARHQHVPHSWSSLGLSRLLRVLNNLVAVLYHHDAIPFAIRKKRGPACIRSHAVEENCTDHRWSFHWNCRPRHASSPVESWRRTSWVLEEVAARRAATGDHPVSTVLAPLAGGVGEHRLDHTHHSDQRPARGAAASAEAHFTGRVIMAVVDWALSSSS